MVPFNIESCIWYGVVLLVALSRFVSRRLALRAFVAFQLDEYVMLLALAFYTTLIVTINTVANTNSNLLPPGYDVAHMTQQDLDERTYGSKLILVVEECQCTVVWCAKACLLIMYLRLTTLRRENIAVKILAAYVAVTFVVMEILYLGVWCRPFSNYWAVPTPNVQCDAATNHLITNAVFNLSSDLAMLAIGLPMFVRMQLPLRKKIPVVGVFSLGVFVIISSILNKVYSFTNPFGTEWVFWYVRESSTALIVANLPFVWLLYRRLFGLSGSVKEMTQQQQRSSLPLSNPRSINKAHGASGSFEADAMDIGATKDNVHTSPVETDDSGGRAHRGVTLQEMLRADGPAMSTADSPRGDRIDPYTHPALFFGSARDRNGRLSAAPPGFSKAVLPARGCHDESPDRVEYLSGTPSSVQTAISAARKSVGSFV